MKVNNITLQSRTQALHFENPQKQKKITFNTNEAQEIQNAKLPSTKDYLSFTGGYSLNLAETIKNLDKLAEKNFSVYPKNIREWAGMILDSGNTAKQTLIDIHKKYYEALKNCTSLNEVKAKFPEFSDVKSDKDVMFSKNSFGEAVKAGEIECFDKNEDLSLQILKLYYGDGFSLNDLKKYTNGKDIYYTMTKLGIPRQNQTYGYILKFSDPEYNERLTAEMTYKRRLALDKKAQAEGEPVYIPRGPLSKEHCEHISEGLQKYWRENPERMLYMSEKMKDFYRQNPEKSEELSRVMKKAWNVYGADRIKGAQSKFMQSKGFKNFQAEANPVDLTKEQSKAMKQFWGSNEWARKAFSKNMEYAWKKVKEENELHYIVNITPNGYRKHFYQWAKENNIDTSNLNFDMIYYPFNKTKNDIDRSELSVYTRRFAVEAGGDEPSKIADAYLLSVLQVNRDLSKLNFKKLSSSMQKLVVDINYTIKEELFGDGFIPIRNIRSIQEMDTMRMQRLYSGLVQECYARQKPEVAALFEKYMNEVYDKIDSGWEPGNSLSMYDFSRD